MAGRLLVPAFRVHTRLLSASLSSSTDVSRLAAMPAKQLGKIAKEVAKHGSSDIRVWSAFVGSCSSRLDCFDGKDTLRLWKGVGVFYRNYGYSIRPDDRRFLLQLLLRGYDVCDGYTCEDLSHLASVVCEFAVANDDMLEFATALFSKLGVLFTIRLAEAAPPCVVRLLVAFSRLGIRDAHLLGSLADFITGNDEFRVRDLRAVVTSYSLVGHRCPELLCYATDRFLGVPELSANDVAIIAFSYASLGYRSADSRRLFTGHLDRLASGIVGADADVLDEIGGLHLPMFCASLDNLHVPIPASIIGLIDITSLDSESFFAVAHLLPVDGGSQRAQVLDRYRAHQQHCSVWGHLRVLDYATRCEFDEVELFSTACRNAATGLSEGDVPSEDSIGSLVDVVCGLHEATDLTGGGVFPGGGDRDSGLSSKGARAVEVTDGGATTPDGDPSGAAVKHVTALDVMMHLLLRAPPAYVHECVDLLGLVEGRQLSRPSLRAFASLMSKPLIDDGQRLGPPVDSVAVSHGSRLFDVLEERLEAVGLCRSPRILRAEFESELGAEATMPCQVGCLTLVTVLEAYKVAVVPLYPQDFVRVGPAPGKAAESWSPPGHAARADVYAYIHYLHLHGYRVAPLSNPHWRSCGDCGSGLLDRLLMLSF